MDWRKLLKPRPLAAAGGVALFLVLAAFFVDALAGYLEVQKYLDRMRDRTFNVQDLNKYKRALSVKQQRLDELRRDTRAVFRVSDLFRRVIEMARRSGIAENDLSLTRVGVVKRGDLEELSLELRAYCTFARLGAFTARLERVAPSDPDRFEYVLRIDRVDIAVRKRTGSELSAKLFVTVYRKAGSDD